MVQASTDITTASSSGDSELHRSKFPEPEAHQPGQSRGKSPTIEPPIHATNTLDANSVHSHASATSGGTTWTREDGISLFTSMSESMMGEIKTQMVELARTTQLNQAVQLAQNIKTDARIESLITALTLSIQHQASNPVTAQQNDSPAHGHGTQPPLATHTQISTTSAPRAMDTEHDNNQHTDSVRRPMDTDVVVYAPPSDQPHT